MTKVSPIAQYLRMNKAIPKHDKFGTHLYSSEGLYIGRLTKSIVNNYKVINLETFGEGFKKMYTKSIAVGQQFIYIKNNSSPLGISLVPIKTYMRKIFVNFVDQTSELKDSEKTLTNKLDLIAIDERTATGLYDTSKPFLFSSKITKEEVKQLKHTPFVHKIH